MEPKREVNRKLIFGIFGACGALCLLGWIVSGGKISMQVFRPKVLSYDVAVRSERGKRDESTETRKFEEQLTEKVKDLAGTYEIYVYRLGDGVGYGINENKQIGAASIMKVPIMTAVFSMIEQGKIKLDDKYVLTDNDKRDGTGSIDNLTVGSETIVAQLVEAMGKESDNTAAAALAHLVGEDVVDKTIKDMGMDDSLFASNQTTALDVAMMWVNIYRARAVDSESRDQMEKYLQDSIYEDRIAIGLPDGVKLLHKVGTSGDIWSDGGIVIPDEPGKQPFVLVILNEGVDLDEAKKVVPDITKMVWNEEQTR